VRRRFVAAVATIAVLAGGALCVQRGALGHASVSGAQTEVCEHGVLRSVCPKCHPELAVVYQAKHDWCPEHGLPESFCPICHPERHGIPPALKGDPSKTEEKPGKDKDKDDDDEEKKVQLAPEVLAKAGVRTAPAAREVLAATLSLSGETQADPDRSARVTSPVAGHVERVMFVQGGSVKKGDALVIVRVPDLGKARAAFTASAARAASARTNASRLAELAKKGLAAEQEALGAKAEADALEADARAAREQLAAIGTGAEGAGSLLTLRAPVSGVVVTRDAIIGQAVTTEQTLASIVDLEEVWFTARVYERDLGRVSLAARAEVVFNAFPSQRFEGTVEYVGQQIDPSSRTFTARIRLSDAGRVMRVGLFGKALVSASDVGKREPVLVVPWSAVTDVKGKPSVFVSEGGGFERRAVSLGERGLGRVQILSGVREGEPVAVDGVFTLKSVLLKGSMEDDD
jgi:cobalt-zinc-cadmium efflux system membrane fusion protein